MTGAELGLRVCSRTEAADRVLLLELRDPTGAPLPAWQPGAHIGLLLAPGLERQYSLCGDPADRGSWRIGVLLEAESRGGSQHVHDKLTTGAMVRARGPRNHFRLQPAAAYRFIAGGIGITPLLPMLAAAEAAGADWTLTYGGRTRAAMAFREELTRRYPGRVTLCPQDETGLPDLDGLLGEPRPGTLVYCCGPEPLLAAAEARCAAWPPGALHMERFTPREAGPGSAFEVELARSGLTVPVPEGCSILRAVEAAGLQVLSSCTEGTCGTCETAVLGGVPEHRDTVLSPAERAAGDIMMICVSRALSPKLVLDL